MNPQKYHCLCKKKSCRKLACTSPLQQKVFKVDFAASKPIPKIIHIVGTNGKGTTGRFLANGLLQNGFSVGHNVLEAEAIASAL
ncbi:MAG: hypothetical protein MUP09_05710 [Thiovulaceae bacterium]|nr:hypothetical protein [Sulfurimonadaceae bacterium]